MPHCPYTSATATTYASPALQLRFYRTSNPLTTPFRPPNTQRAMPQVLASTTRLSARVMRVRLNTSPLPEPCP